MPPRAPATQDDRRILLDALLQRAGIMDLPFLELFGRIDPVSDFRSAMGDLTEQEAFYILGWFHIEDMGPLPMSVCVKLSSGFMRPWILDRMEKQAAGHAGGKTIPADWEVRARAVLGRLLVKRMSPTVARLLCELYVVAWELGYQDDALRRSMLEGLKHAASEGGEQLEQLKAPLVKRGIMPGNGGSPRRCEPTNQATVSVEVLYIDAERYTAKGDLKERGQVSCTAIHRPNGRAIDAKLPIATLQLLLEIHGRGSAARQKATVAERQVVRIQEHLERLGLRLMSTRSTDTAWVFTLSLPVTMIAADPVLTAAARAKLTLDLLRDPTA